MFDFTRRKCNDSKKPCHSFALLLLSLFKALHRQQDARQAELRNFDCRGTTSIFVRRRQVNRATWLSSAREETNTFACFAPLRFRSAETILSRSRIDRRNIPLVTKPPLRSADVFHNGCEIVRPSLTHYPTSCS